MTPEGDDFRHDPVLLTASLDLLKPQAGETVMDVTLGLGGHASAFLEKIGSDGLLIGLDADIQNLHAAEKKLKGGSNLRFIHANFRRLAHLDLPTADIIFADLGLSSPHIDDASRGFTFREDVPLDMRFDRTTGTSAAELIAHSSQQHLTQFFRQYGELREASALAKKIHQSFHGKEKKPVATTGDLKRVVEEVCGWRAPSALPKVFQALRIAVNDELGALESLLATAPDLLKKGGRFGVISYHSLEDRLVKQSFRALTAGAIDDVTGQIARPAPFALLTRKAIVPTDEEIARNPRARSAKLRGIQKISD